MEVVGRRYSRGAKRETSSSARIGRERPGSKNMRLEMKSQWIYPAKQFAGSKKASFCVVDGGSECFVARRNGNVREWIWDWSRQGATLRPAALCIPAELISPEPMPCIRQPTALMN